MNQRVRPEFLAQRATVDTEYAGRQALIAMRVIHDGLKQRPFHLANNEIVEIAGAIAIEVFKILFDCVFGVLVQRFIVVLVVFVCHVG